MKTKLKNLFNTYGIIKYFYIVSSGLVKEESEKLKNDVTGILVLWKPKGITSFQAVRKVKRLFETNKVGHTGTLDPDVDGVLPICLGRATKLVEYLSAHKKTYSGEVTLGFSTTTEDATGEVVEKKLVDEEISKHDIINCFAQLEGELLQTPPMYSAVKVKGKRLYEYAREGKSVERPTRKVTIYSLTLNGSPERTDDGLLRIPFTVTCSKGTYVRTLCVTIGEKLGYPAHMSKLTRLESSIFTKDDCITLEQLQEMNIDERLDCLKSIEYALRDYPSIIVDNRLEKKILNGIIIEKSRLNIDESFIALYNQQGECLALYKDHPKKNGWMKPAKMLVT